MFDSIIPVSLSKKFMIKVAFLNTSECIVLKANFVISGTGG
jgi:hypothetical protein